MKEDWEQEMEDFFDNMSEEDFKEFLRDTDYEFYTSEHFKNASHLYPQWLQDLCKEHGVDS